MPAENKKIPNSDVLEFVVRDILRKRSVGSQRELAEIANKRFHETSSSFRVSPGRARLAALKIGAKATIRTRSGSEPKHCPGCGCRLRKSYMKNLRGRNLILGMKCTHCGYEGRCGKWVPSRYGFARICSVPKK